LGVKVITQITYIVIKLDGRRCNTGLVYGNDDEFSVIIGSALYPHTISQQSAP